MRKIVLGFCCLMLSLGTAHARELQPYRGGATPPLVLHDLNGKLHDLQDYRGRVVLINFWATWCPPCRAEMPSMRRLNEKLAGRPFTILTVDMAETPQEVSAFLTEVNLDFTVLMDRDGKALKQWKVFAFPTSFLVDPEGKIRYAVFGTTEWDEAEAVAKVNELLPAQIK